MVESAGAGPPSIVLFERRVPRPSNSSRWRRGTKGADGVSPKDDNFQEIINNTAAGQIKRCLKYDKKYHVHRAVEAFLDLTRIYTAPLSRFGSLVFEGQGAFAPQR
jgi:hypothetical protein